MADNSGWVSAVCSIISVFIGLITLVTVFVAARQLLTEHRIYELGLSTLSLGPWHTKVNRKQLLGMQQQIVTPTLSLPNLLKNEWQPRFIFPIGFHHGAQLDNSLETAPAQATWVNFLQALGISPENDQHYHMTFQPNLVNGIIPMRWAGKTLVALSSLLGFQSYEDKPSFRNPFPLPMQWSGPIGWLQFRQGPSSCIVEFRRRTVMADQLSSGIHDYYRNKKPIPRPDLLKMRLWRSINSMYLSEGRVLYLGGADRGNSDAERKKLLQKLEDMKEFLSKITRERGHQESELERENTDLFDALMQRGLSDAEVKQALPSGELPSPEPRSVTPEETEKTLRFPGRLKEKMLGQKELIIPCPGLLSIIVEQELADTRGLNTKDCIEYHRMFVSHNDVDPQKFPYNFGDLYMDAVLLPLLKEAMVILRPDGYYFTPVSFHFSDILEIYHHVRYTVNEPERFQIFHSFEEGDWPSSTQHREILHQSMCLCNEFQHIRKHNRAVFTIADMVVIYKASELLFKIIEKETDLRWAMLACPELLYDLAEAFAGMWKYGW
ncbi:hypothetical protein F4806DRAFT_503188 [Annulohypoxylon nitens]|nr:hypothetical protein F4806DRAFT_503188 [Annulohypoxylon nitens]